MTHPFVGGLVRQALLMKRASECRHDWSVELPDGEVQCNRCTIIAASRAFADSLPFGTNPASQTDDAGSSGQHRDEGKRE